jgi:hypothetical protein
MSLTSEQVKREMGYDIKKDRAMINEPSNMNIAGATVKKGGILERPGDQPSPNVEKQKNAGEIADAKRWKDLGDNILGQQFITENEKFVPELQTDLPRPHGDKLLEH